MRDLRQHVWVRIVEGLVVGYVKRSVELASTGGRGEEAVVFVAKVGRHEIRRIGGLRQATERVVLGVCITLVEI